MNDVTAGILVVVVFGSIVLMFCNPGGDHPDHERED